MEIYIPQEFYLSLKERFSNLPVAINNYYGDPVIQWDDTMQKIERLAKDGHKGVVTILTRGYISKERAKRLSEIPLNLLVIPPISHLKKIEVENHEQRYKTIENLLNVGVNVLPNIRPIIMGYNDKEIPTIYKRLKELGIRTVVVSGIRGNDEVLLKTMSEEESRKYSLRIKIIPKELGESINECSEKEGIESAKRVSCGVALLFNKQSHNPYWNSPHLVGCSSCRLKSICYDDGIKDKQPPDDMKFFLNAMGFIWRKYNDGKTCTVSPEKRLECFSCCTGCWVHGGNTIMLDNKPISLGTMAFLRFLFKGWTFTHYGIRDLGLPDTSTAYLPTGYKSLGLPRYPEAVNTWYVLARQTTKCFGCSYCITYAYKPKMSYHGVYPMDLFNGFVKYVESIKNEETLYRNTV